MFLGGKGSRALASPQLPWVCSVNDFILLASAYSFVH